MNEGFTGIPILTYHSIDESGSRISVSRAEFERQIRSLKQWGYSCISLRQGVTCLRQGKDLPERAMIITFDDGYRNNLEEALPVLSDHRFTATVFVTTAHVGGHGTWPDQHASIPRLAMMTWEEIKDMRKAGIDFGAHTHNHVRLSEVDVSEARREMLRSKAEIEEHLSEKIHLFSYPFGSHNPIVRGIAATFFEGAIGNRPGRLHRRSNLYAIDRINVTSGLFKALPMGLSRRANFGVYLSAKRGFNLIHDFTIRALRQSTASPSR